MPWKESESHSDVSNSLLSDSFFAVRPTLCSPSNSFFALRPTLCCLILRPHGLYSPWNSPGQKTRVGSLFLLQEIFPTQGLNPGLPYYRQILYQLSHKGSPRILRWVVYPSSSGSSQPRNQTGVFCIAGKFFTKLPKISAKTEG